MKFNKEDPSLETDSNEEEIKDTPKRDPTTIEDTINKYYCPNCTTLMISFQDIAVQCELLTDMKSGPFLEIVSDINTGSRRGSIQSVTEVMEEVPYDEGIVTIDETTAPDETVLVTRSFENQAMPEKPRRSSIAFIIDTIKSMRTRLMSEPARNSSQEVNSVENNDDYERGHSSKSQTHVNPKDMSSDDLKSMGNNVHRKSFQLNNGTVVEEVVADYDADKAVPIIDDSTTGEVNFISRSFEVVPESPSERRESLIDKINPLKLIEKIRRGSQTLIDNNVEENRKKEEQNEPMFACSGVRRKSLAPALLLDSTIEEVDKEDTSDFQEDNANENETKVGYVGDSNLKGTVNGELVCMNPMRFVECGIRRGSVAAVSATPPCRDQEVSQMEQDHPSGSENNQEKVRFITEGIRRGSVAMVSAAPPCISLNAGQADEGESRNSNTELRVDGEDCLRSGIRRRSLTVVNEESQGTANSPVPGKRVSFGPAPENDEPESERERSSSDAADEFMNRITKRYIGKETETRNRKKGAVSLFERLTGREMGVDYSSIDAKKIQEKFDAEFDEKQETAPRASIPIITFSEDISDDEDALVEREGTEINNQVLDNEK